MLPKENISEIQPQIIKQLLEKHYYSLVTTFYETQSVFLSGIYKRYGGIETANIILCFARNMHLEIIRQRERNLNYNVSLKNFWYNLNNVTKPLQKITTIVKTTGIPKETVRRKIKYLTSLGYLENMDSAQGYCWSLSLNHKDTYLKIIDEEIKNLAKFTFKFSNYLNLNLSVQAVENEIKSQFSFYWYHFLSCQLQWLKIWQDKLKDNDLLLIALQTIIPALQYGGKHNNKVNLDNIFKIIGKIEDRYSFSQTAVSATAVSTITGIPRATCIRKLNKLVALGFVLREAKSKRYFINQNSNERTKNILTKDNVDKTVEIFGKYLSIILTSLVHSRNNNI
tara:strand:+ start:820 stop:1836 length:1017 start_codon:yes stop_codon:yes gene_type:complete